MPKNERGFIQHHFWLKNGARALPSTILEDEKKSGAGFTLMELLIAMVITVLLVASLFNVFNLAARAWQKGEARTQRYQNLRQALDRMSDDIRSAILLSLANNPGKADCIRFYGENNSEAPYGDKLSFIAVSHPPDGWAYESDWTASPPKLRFDCCELSYYVTLSSGDTKLIRRVQTSKVPDLIPPDDDDGVCDITSGGSSNVLSEHITKLDFTYYDPAAPTTPRDSWDSGPAGDAYCKGKLPTRVRIELTAQADLAREQKEEKFTTEVWLGNANFGQ